MSQSPGDLPLEMNAATGTRGRPVSRSAKWLIIVLSALAVFAGVVSWWRSTPAPPRWMDIREGYHPIMSLATGRDPDGNEIIVTAGYCRTEDDTGRDLRIICYDVMSGHVRWEIRENQALPYRLTNPVLTMDSTGDVLVGWQSAMERQGENRLISKYSGRDGHLVWNWKVEDVDQGAYWKAIPASNSTDKDKLWVSGIRRENEKEYPRFVAVLDPQTGIALWRKELVYACTGFDNPARICSMQDGGAILVIPHSVRGEKPLWLIEHRSSDGEIKWQHRISDVSDLFGANVPLVVDETHGQAVLCWAPDKPSELHFAALDLATGNERWHVRPHFSGGVDALTPGHHGQTEWWTSDGPKIVHSTKWWCWKMVHGFPQPMRQSERIEQPMRITLSPNDGSIVEQEKFARPNESVAWLLTEPGSDSVKTVMLQTMEGLSTIENPAPAPPLEQSWRAIGLDSMPLSGFFARHPGGYSAPDAFFPNHAALTPSGHLVIAGSPAPNTRQWQIRVW